MNMTQKFYVFTHNSHYNRKYTWAFRVHSRSEMIEREHLENGIWIRRSYASGAFDVSIEGGSEYPDILGCGAYPYLIVSEAVILDWQQAGIKSFHTYPVGIAEIISRSKRLRAASTPRYFRVEIDGRCQIDKEASVLHINRYRPLRFQMVSGSWDGSSLFRDVDLYPNVKFCTEQILTLARVYKRTNFRFEHLESPIDPSTRGIEYLK